MAWNRLTPGWFCGICPPCHPYKCNYLPDSINVDISGLGAGDVLGGDDDPCDELNSTYVCDARLANDNSGGWFGFYASAYVNGGANCGWIYQDEGYFGIVVGIVGAVGAYYLAVCVVGCGVVGPDGANCWNVLYHTPLDTNDANHIDETLDATDIWIDNQIPGANFCDLSGISIHVYTD